MAEKDSPLGPFDIYVPWQTIPVDCDGSVDEDLGSIHLLRQDRDSEVTRPEVPEEHAEETRAAAQIRLAGLGLGKADEPQKSDAGQHRQHRLVGRQGLVPLRRVTLGPGIPEADGADQQHDQRLRTL